MSMVNELVLDGGPDAVPKARRFTRDSLAGESGSVLDDAELLVSELVTNAVLHGSPPVTVRLRRGPGPLRIEVEDTGVQIPVEIHEAERAMTGRGLALVAAVASGWGIGAAAHGGKVVWARLDSEGAEPGSPQGDRAPAPAVPVSHPSAPDPSGEPLYTIRLGRVPTNLLVRAKLHIDDVAREFSLGAAEREARGEPMPGPVARLVDTVTKTFGPARAEIKRQALAAAARGDAETDLVLTLPASAADAGERYLAALDEADRYARSARLLTLASPPVDRVLRRWYVDCLVAQLRAQARGDEPPSLPTFVEALADELGELAALRDSWDRLQLLQKVTGELTGARTVEDVAATVVDNASQLLGATTVRVLVLGEDRTLRAIAVHGADEVGAEGFSVIPVDADLPAAATFRTGQSLLVRNRAELEARFPRLAGALPTERTLHVAPLVVSGNPIGVLALTFPGGSQVDEATQVAFVRALGDALAQALERALAMQRAAEANERLAFLADASVALSASLDYEETVEAVARLMVPRLADWCVVQVLEDDELKTVALRHFDPERLEWANRLAGRYPTRMDSPTGAPNVLRTGRSEMYPEIRAEMVEAAAVDEEHLAILREVGMSSALVVPLTGRSGTFGAVTLIYAESGRRYSPSDRPFVEDVALRAALALETAHTFEQQSDRLEDVTRIAEAAQLAILAPPPRQIGPVALTARYVSAAAEALVGGDLYEVVPRSGAVRLLIGDVRGKGLNAVRTATVVLGEFRSAASDGGDLARVAGQIDRRLRQYLGDEDFVTGLLAEIRDDGTYSVASCGHPPAIVVSGGRMTEIRTEPCLPLGLGAEPSVVSGRLGVGDRLFLYTDGIVEARDPQRNFVDPRSLLPLLAGGPLDGVLDDMLDALRAAVGHELGDDLALLVAEYRG